MSILDDEIVLHYSGALGTKQGIDIILESGPQEPKICNTNSDIDVVLGSVRGESRHPFIIPILSEDQIFQRPTKYCLVFGKFMCVFVFCICFFVVF